MRRGPSCCAEWAAARSPATAYDRAIDLAGNAAEITHLTRHRDQLGAPADDGR